MNTFLASAGRTLANVVDGAVGVPGRHRTVCAYRGMRRRLAFVSRAAVILEVCSPTPFGRS